jgi:hypothetical protein
MLHHGQLDTLPLAPVFLHSAVKDEPLNLPGG